MIRTLSNLLIAALVAATPLAAQQVAVAAPSAATAAFPETPAGRVAAAMLETVRGGDTTAIRAFIAERMTGRIATEPWDRQLGLFRRMRNDFGGGRVVSATPTSEGLRVVIVAPEGRFTLTLGVEPQPPHRISRFGVEAVPGGDEGEAPTPAARPATSAGPPESVRLPDTPAGRAAQALLETMRGGDSIAIRRFVAERMDAGFQSRPWDRQLGLFRRMRDDFGDGRIVAATPSANGIQVVLVSPRGRFAMNLGVEQAPPYRINDLSVEANPDGGDGGAGAPGATTITAADQRAVIDSIGRMLERVYPSADTGRMIAERLRGRERSGAYAAMTTAGAFATAVTQDMRSINGDRHLNLSAGGPRRVRRGPAGDEEARAANYGMGSRVMEGGIGYLRLDGLSGAPQAPARLGELLRDMGDIRAMIIDLRGAPGGSAQMANAVISHFTAPNLPSLRVVNRSEGTEEVRNTLAQVPGPRRTDIPLYVLVDRGSGSAAEDVPFVLQNFHRATIVGETTAGAGRNNTIVPVGSGLAASISVTRVSDPRTGREWERVGVKPDIEASSEQALEAALRAIRERGR